MAFVETEIHGQIMVIRLNRPDRLNALSTVVREGMGEAFTTFRDSESLEGAILTGTGRSFCVGEDMKEALQRGEPGLSKQKIENPFNDATLQKPVIAAINGVSIGEGLTRTLPCDVRVASDTARLSFRFLRVGLTPEVASTHYAVYLIGLGRTLELMLTGELLPADEAFRIGLVNHIYPTNQLLEKAVELAGAIADNPNWNLAKVKHLVHQDYLEHDIDKVLADESKIFRESQGRDAHKEALLAFREKRAPNFH